MTTSAMNFDPTVHGTVAGKVTEVGGQKTVTPGVNGAAMSTAGTSATGLSVPGAGAQGTGGFAQKLQAFEGFLKRAGSIAGVVLADVVKFVVPVVQVAALADPTAAAAMRAFATSLQLVQATVISAQQRWVTDGSSANDKKLADVLTVVEQPIVQMFEQVGLHVDTAYVVNLVNGVVAILNAQPANTLGTAS